MSAKLYLVVVTGLVLSGAVVLQAADSQPQWDGQAADRLWATDKNWSGDAVPGADDSVYLLAPAAGAGTGPMIEAATAAQAHDIWLGHGVLAGGESRLVMTGGTVTADHLMVGHEGDLHTHGIFELSAGVVNLSNHITVGSFGAMGTLEMTGGRINAHLFLSCWNGGSGHTNLRGGVIDVEDFVLDGGTMDITGGKLVIDGDLRDRIDGYINGGELTAYGGDARAQVCVDFDGCYPGRTTVWARLATGVHSGWDIFDASHGGAYRYGPSMIINDDGSMDAWFASPGGSGQWDWIRYKHSPDGGYSWEPEMVVLRPTPGSADGYSCCDPGVVRFGGYYYLGYTSTLNEKGVENHVFVSRSASPTGPFEKWNGNGWGGAPEPMIEWTGSAQNWGAGEPSFVVKDGTVYIYFTWGGRTNVATAPASDANWPGNLTDHGTAISRAGGEDSTDVKYVDALGRFIGMATASRFSANSYIHVWESFDGLRFTEAERLQGGWIQPWAHNAGISGTAEGHIDISRQNFLGYAYSKNGGVSWAYWYTHLNPLSFTLRQAYGWRFEQDGDFEGWQTGEGLSNAVVADGVLRFEVSGDGADMRCDSVVLNPFIYKYLHVRMRNGTADDSACLYWLRQGDERRGRDSIVRITTVPFDDGFRDYWVYLSSCPNWNERVTKLIMVPSFCEMPGLVEIDCIEFTEVPGFAGDADADGFVDWADITAVAGGWLEFDQNLVGDLDDSYDVNLLDLAVLAADWLNCRLQQPWAVR